MRWLGSWSGELRLRLGCTLDWLRIVYWFRNVHMERLLMLYDQMREGIIDDELMA
jgi:hypothetical protein